MPEGEPLPGGLESTSPPPHLSAEAKREWTRLAPELLRLGLLTMADLPGFTVFCASWGDYVTADKALQREGLIVDGKEGQRVR